MPAAAPRSVSDARRLLAARGLRGFADGFVSVLLASHLTALGFSALQVGAIATATLAGSAALTLGVGFAAHRLAERRVLLAASLVMVATGLGFAGLSGFWWLLALAFVGTLNPSSGDVSVFVPTEQALLAASTEAPQRTALFARYNLGGTLAGALGAGASGLPAAAAAAFGWPLERALRAGFLGYAAIGVAVGALYRGLRRERAASAGAPPRSALRTRGVVLRLSALFSLDAFGGGFVVNALLALWLFRRFALSPELAGTVFFAAGVLAGLSQLASAPLARRIGLVRTMVYTHVPANLFLVAAAFMPSAGLAIACLLARMAVSSMDVPARQSLVMALVPPEERAAAASVTNVPRSLAAAAGPLLAGALLERSDFGWPLVCGGLLKLAYDGLLLAGFRALPVAGDPLRGPRRSPCS